MSELSPLDPGILSDVLSKHPFVTIDGVCNIRDLGMIPTTDGENVTRSGFMYRSGNSLVSLNLVCAFLSSSLVFGTTLETRQGTAADSRYHYHIRPPFRHGNCKVRCSNPTNCGNNSITRTSLCKGGLQPRAYGPVSSALDPPESALLCLLRRFQLYASGKTEVQSPLNLSSSAC